MRSNCAASNRKGSLIGVYRAGRAMESCGSLKNAAIGLLEARQRDISRVKLTFTWGKAQKLELTILFSSDVGQQ